MLYTSLDFSNQECYLQSNFYSWWHCVVACLLLVLILCALPRSDAARIDRVSRVQTENGDGPWQEDAVGRCSCRRNDVLELLRCLEQDPELLMLQNERSYIVHVAFEAGHAEILCFVLLIFAQKQNKTIILRQENISCNIALHIAVEQDCAVSRYERKLSKNWCF